MAGGSPAGETYAVLRRSNYGSPWIDAVIAVYATLDSPTKLLTEDDCFEDPDPDANALAPSCPRYARGELKRPGVRPSPRTAARKRVRTRP